MKLRFKSKETVCNVQRLDIRPGDKLLVTLPVDTSQDVVNDVSDRFVQFGIPVLVTTDNASVSVVRQAN